MKNTENTTNAIDNPGQLDTATRVAPADLPRNYRVSRCVSCEGGRFAVAWKGGTARPACPKCGAAMTTTTRNLKAGFVVLEGEALELAERLEGGILNDVEFRLDNARRFGERLELVREAIAAGAEVDERGYVRTGKYSLDVPPARLEELVEKELAKAAKFRRRLEKLGGPLGAKAVAKAEALASAEAELRGLAPVAGGSNELDELVTARAELIVLESYDAERERRGHDYGGGQRRSEIMRRTRELTEARRLAGALAGRRLEVPEPTDLDVAAAARRLLAPRLARVDREGYRLHTPSTGRTREALVAVLGELCPTYADAGDTGEEEAIERLSDEERREATRIRRELERRGVPKLIGGTNELDADLDHHRADVEAKRRHELDEAGRLRAVGTFIAERAAEAAEERVGRLAGWLAEADRRRQAGDVRVALLALRGAKGDKVAARAANAYRTDAELERAERVAAAQDYTDAGRPVDEDASGRLFEVDR